jgi:beta-glucosidase
VDYVQDGGGSQVNFDWTIPKQDLHTPAINLARSSDLAVVFVNLGEDEGADLSNIDLSGVQNQLVSDVAAANPNTVVVINSGSAVTMPWAGVRHRRERRRPTTHRQPCGCRPVGTVRRG